jgi:LuxR family maltose regulon positive regulatory protein
MSVTTIPRHRPPVLALRPDPAGTAAAAAPAGLEDSASAKALHDWLVQSLLLEAIARDSFGDAAGAAQALGRALDLTEHARNLVPFLVDPVPALLQRHGRQCATHADLIFAIFDRLAGKTRDTPPHRAEPLHEPLTEGELRVLRLLPTNLSKREIGDELFLSVNTIKAHTKHLYAKLDVHSRREAVERARELGLLSHSRV